MGWQGCTPQAGCRPARGKTTPARPLGLSGACLPLSTEATYLKRAHGEEVATITCKVVSLHDTHLIEMKNGQTVELRSELLHATKDVLDIEALGWQLVGDLVQHNYRLADVNDEGRLLAQTHRRWLSLHNTYEIEILDEARADLIVAVLVALDKIVEDRERVMRSPSAASVQGSSAQE